MKEIKISSMNKMAWMLSRKYFSEDDFTLDGNRLILSSTVEEDYLELLEEYRKFEEENREFLKAFKQLKLIRNSLLEEQQEEGIE